MTSEALRLIKQYKQNIFTVFMLKSFVIIALGMALYSGVNECNIHCACNLNYITSLLFIRLGQLHLLCRNIRNNNNRWL